MLSEIFFGISALAGAAGAYLMASRYVNFGAGNVLLVLISALFRGRYAQQAVEIAELSQEKGLYFLQGLALCMFGIACTVVSEILKAYGH